MQISLNTIIKLNKIIERDTLESSYKLALLKSLILVIKKFDHHIIKINDFVKVPFYFVVEEWFFYYIPFVYLNIRQHKSRSLVINQEIERLYWHIFDEFSFFCKNDDWKCIYALIYKKYFNFELNIDKIFRALRRLIVSNPMKYMGDSEYQLFPKNRIEKIKIVNRNEFEKFGYFEIDHEVYRVLKYLGDNFYGVNTIIFRWEELLNRINKFSEIKSIKEILTHDIEELIRNTSEIHKLFKDQLVYCVWSGRKIKKFDVDHMFPFSILLNNDYWNLLPASPDINNKKRDKIPSPDLIDKSKERILDYWYKYKKEFAQFENQRKISLGYFDTEKEYILQLKNKSEFFIDKLGYVPFK